MKPNEKETTTNNIWSTKQDENLGDPRLRINKLHKKELTPTSAAIKQDHDELF